MKILSVGWFQKVSNTSLHRHWALEQNANEITKIDLGKSKTSFKYKLAYHLFQKGLPIPLPDESDANQQIIKSVTKLKYDILWIDKGVTINKKTLLFVKQNSPKTIIVSYSPDNMALRHNQSQNYLNSLSLYDYIFTNKSYILEDMKNLGAKNIKFIHNMYEASFHYPRELSNTDIEQLGGDVGFIGAWEKERFESILYLAKNGINVKVLGDGKWNDFKTISPNLTIQPGVFSEEYSKALSAFKISLCFLRKMNFDQQTTRTMEIPACGGFMMAERTQEHQELFEEGKEAAYFSSNEELLKLCKYYLANKNERTSIAKAGLERCISSGYSNERTIKKMLDIVSINE
ncbi:glycosyltransferase family 1 protein [Cellulophaga sp. HaHaR_3_176]|uniref:CgeB family protein n=1 Tax=Cellulophaga sp. HaHaR_3_176 TaxID=1942464 RepID=UPI001C1FD08D|nr:glycosyltransferase [Cellulophaga sp. HaHaR_3_176]QWX83325.1 glycosyltransferase family 1 protein [Cellulophaga sp. HaHaR_3_176]